MTVEAWSANVVKIGEKWFASLIDFPGLGVVGDTRDEALLSASRVLSDAVRETIAAGQAFPRKSEPQPGQELVPLDEDALSRLSELRAALIHRQREHEQLQREKEQVYLMEHRLNLEPIERLQSQTNQAATHFASMAINFGYLINGGALVAIPAIIQFSEKGTLNKSSIVASASFFALGIILSAVTNLFAYRSMYSASEGHQKEMEARTLDVWDKHHIPSDWAARRQRAGEIRANSDNEFASARTSANIGVGIFMASIATFILGIGSIILGF